jgi:large subunit ribosomal protein L24
MYTPPRKKGPRRNDAQFTGKILLRTGDTVRVLAGKDKGKEGKVTQILRSEGKVVVEGVNIVIKHQKPRPQGAPTMGGQTPQGGRIELASPLHVAKVQLVDPADGKTGTRIGVKTDENGERVRFAKKSGGVISNG